MSEGQDKSASTWVPDLMTPWKGEIKTAIVSWVQRRLQNITQSGQLRAQAKRERIAAWRAAVDRDDFDHLQFAHSNAYATLRGYLPEDLQQEIDRWRDPMMVIASPRRGRDSRQVRLLQEIARVEREWRLI
jgi:hypothetical protein